MADGESSSAAAPAAAEASKAADAAPSKEPQVPSADAAASSSSAASSAPATSELSQQPKAESLRPGGTLRPQRFGANKDKGASGAGGAASGSSASSSTAGQNRPGGGGGGVARRSYGSASKGPAEPKPKPQASSAAGGGDDGDTDKAAEKVPEKVIKTEADAKTADGLHRLQTSWTFWFDKPQGHTARRVKGATAATEVYESSLREVGTFDTVEGFWRHFNFMRKPSDLEVGANYHLFKTGVKPMWEDRANAHGGKWQVRVKDRHSLDEFWQNLVLALIGETADDDDGVCGVVMSRRRGGDRLAVWTRRKDESVRPLGILLKQFMLDDPAGTKKTSAGVALEFSHHESSMKSGSSYGSDVVFTV